MNSLLVFTGSVEYIGSDDFNISVDNSQVRDTCRYHVLYLLFCQCLFNIISSSSLLYFSGYHAVVR